MEIVAKSAEQAFHKILNNLSLYGVETAPRGLKIKELINCCITIKNPRDRIVSCPERKMNMAYAFGELCWYLSGRNDLEMMKYYSKFMERGTDDGVTLNSAYGYRIFTGKHKLIGFNQWENVKRILREDSDSRQAIIHLHTPNDKKTNDEVCTLCLQFFIRNGKLDMITTMRSNDVFLGFTYDVFSFTMLQEILANELGVEVGTYYHNVGSMHIYENRFYMLEKHTNEKLVPMEKFDYCLEDFKGIIDFEKKCRENIVNMNTTKIDELAMKLKESNDNLYCFAASAFLLKVCNVLKIDTFIQNYILNNVREKNENYADILQQIGTFNRNGKKIIICGVDASGKSTIAESFEIETNCQAQHYCKPSRNFGYYKNYMLNLNNDSDIVFDRFFISEIVYSNVFKRECKLTKKQIDNLFKRCKNIGAKFIFLIAKDKNQIDLICNRLKSEDIEIKKYVDVINEKYKQISNKLIKNGFNVEIREVK